MLNARHPAIIFYRQRFASFLVCLLLSATAAASETTNDDKDNSVIGRWRFLSILDFAQVSIGQAQAKKLLGKELLISADKIEFGNRYCQQSEFDAKRVETNIELTENARISNERLQLPNPVTVVELSCAYVYIRNHDRMVFAWNGIFFDIARIKGKKLAKQPSPPQN